MISSAINGHISLKRAPTLKIVEIPDMMEF